MVDQTARGRFDGLRGVRVDGVPERLAAAKGFFVGGDDADTCGEKVRVGVCDCL